MLMTGHSKCSVSVSLVPPDYAIFGWTKGGGDLNLFAHVDGGQSDLSSLRRHGELGPLMA